MKLNPCNLTFMAVIALSGWAMAADHKTPSVAPDEALSRLKAGNERFAKSKESSSKPVAALRAKTAQEQHPFAIIVGCADSRTAPEIIFDQNIGDLFVVRTAGNLVDDYALGSIEYAVEHLGARLIVVLGHERCGAVTAALGGESAPGHINSLVRDIQPAVAASKGKEGDALTNAIHENDAEVAAKIRKQAELGELASQVRVVEGYYDLDTGKVEWAAK
jgi:carbonic anhydrase